MKIIIFVTILFIVLLSGCTMVNEYTIEDSTWKLSSSYFGVSSSSWNNQYYRFKNGKIYFTTSSTDTNPTAYFNYSMSSNVIKIRSLATATSSSTAELAEGNYRVYFYNENMKFHDTSSNVEKYSFFEY